MSRKGIRVLTTDLATSRSSLNLDASQSGNARAPTKFQFQSNASRCASYVYIYLAHRPLFLVVFGCFVCTVYTFLKLSLLVCCTSTIIKQPFPKQGYYTTIVIMAPVAITPPPVEVKARPGLQRTNTANMGTRRKIICFSGKFY